VKISWS